MTSSPVKVEPVRLPPLPPHFNNLPAGEQAEQKPSPVKQELKQEARNCAPQQQSSTTTTPAVEPKKEVLVKEEVVSKPVVSTSIAAISTSNPLDAIQKMYAETETQNQYPDPPCPCLSTSVQFAENTLAVDPLCKYICVLTLVSGLLSVKLALEHSLLEATSKHSRFPPKPIQKRSSHFRLQRRPSWSGWPALSNDWTSSWNASMACHRPFQPNGHGSATRSTSVMAQLAAAAASSGNPLNSPTLNKDSLVNRLQMDAAAFWMMNPGSFPTPQELHRHLEVHINGTANTAGHSSLIL
uniref:Uncharacterized protein n=1 Tax=Ditylenchus dipsaci TaxID=166011 RepID=A0A915DJH0_9BILA